MAYERRSAALLIQSVYRRRRSAAMSDYIRDKLTCVICREEGDCLSCRNGHPHCRQCLSTRSFTQHFTCCVCRDDRGYIPSPYTPFANEFGLRWKCEDCSMRCPLSSAHKHRATCPFQLLQCPVHSCTRNVRRKDLANHVREDHTARERVVLQDNLLGIVAIGGGGSVLIVKGEAVVQVVVSGHACLMSTSESYYTVHVSSFGAQLKATLKNIDPHTKDTRDVAYVNIQSGRTINTPVTCARMRAHAKVIDSFCIAGYAMHAFDLPAEEGNDSLFSFCKSHNLLPRSCPIEDDAIVFDGQPLGKSTTVACMTFELLR